MTVRCYETLLISPPPPPGRGVSDSDLLIHRPSQRMKPVALRELLHCLLGSFAANSYTYYIYISAFNICLS